MQQKEVFVSLKKKKDIQAVFKKGEKLNTENLFLRYLTVTGEPNLQVLFAVPKDLKKAVERNRLKRVLKAALFLALKSWGKPNKTILAALHVRKSFLDLPLEKRISEIQKLFKPFYQKNEIPF